MLEVVPTKSFKRDLKKYKHRKEIIEEVYKIISALAKEELLDPKNKDHNLIGNFVNYRECRVKSDVLLIYQEDQNSKSLYLVRLGSHSELF